MAKQWFTERNKCPACLSTSYIELYAKGYEESPVFEYLEDFYSRQGMFENKYIKGANYILCECSECKLVFQKEIPNNALRERLYDHWISPEYSLEQSQKENDRGYYAYLAQEILHIISYVGKLPAEIDILDFGMGWGHWTLMAKSFGCNAYGTDISNSRIQHAKSNGIHVLNNDEFSKHEFDFINAEQVFEHLPEPLMDLRFLAGALKPNGLIKISVPTAKSLKKYLTMTDWRPHKHSRNPIEPIAPLEHINTFQRSSILQMGKAANLEEAFLPLKIQYGYMTDSHNISKVARNLLRPLKLNYFKTQNYIFLKKS